MKLALYAIGDLHLSFNSNKPMDVFGGGWKDYVSKLTAGFNTLHHDDMCVLCGDISWGMTLEESLEDFLFIESLPGRKIVLKGNHDYWWATASKMKAFFDKYDIRSIEILHNNCFFYENVAICGTRGWFSDDELTASQNEKIISRETTRLHASLQAAADAEIKACFFHYPPRFKNTVNHDMIRLMDEFGVTFCCYGHLHGEGHRLAVQGVIDGVDYKIVSADFVDFIPQRLEYGK
jgi:hypothetical protein